jgi:immune inhibitor A
VHLLAQLVDFSDKTATVTANLTAIDNLLFAPQAVGRGSVRDYFADVSYGRVDVVTLNLPSAVGWTRAPQTYAYYVNAQGGMFGAYPQNTGRMVEDLLPLVDSVVDFSQYDNDGDGFVDTLLVMHAGTGAEWSTNMNDMWSHASSITNMGGTAPTLDGVTVDNYFISPEYLEPGLASPTSTDMTIGVICHETGHGLWGLPDLYDLDLSSSGIGTWGLMSYGDWNGPAKFNTYLGFSVTDGSSPALPNAWSRMVMGFDVPFLVNSTGQPCLVPAESLPGGILRFESSLVGGPPGEYFLLENRQALGGGYDQYIPGSGLLIWHIDEQMWSRNGGSDNNWECGFRPHCWGNCTAGFPYWHYLVSLEQADGFDNLELGANRGDNMDPFPGGTTNTAWQPWNVNQRNPESGSWYDTLCSVSTQIEVTGINITGPPLLLACMTVVQPGTGIFQNGFESGNTAVWSTVVP